MDIFSWKYLNERFRVLLWAMSLTKESEHLASHRLSVKTQEDKVSVNMNVVHGMKCHHSLY